MHYKKISLVVAFVALLPIISYAQTFVPLVGIPQLSGAMDLGSYINALYALSISIAALLAVIKIIIAGVKWMLSDVVSSIQEAKSDIQGALLGLLIVISAVLVLGQINPQLVTTNLVLTPVAKAPNNNVGGTGSPSVLAPAPVVSPNIPASVRNISCDAGTSILDYNCVTARDQCTSSGGAVTTNWSGLGSISCRQGGNRTEDCVRVATGGAVGYSCTAAENTCKAPGQIITVLRKGASINCYTPFPVP